MHWKWYVTTMFIIRHVTIRFPFPNRNRFSVNSLLGIKKSMQVSMYLFIGLQSSNCFVILNRHQTILQTFLNFFLNLTLPGVPHPYKQLPNGQYLSDLCKMCNLDANLWKSWIGDHRILTYIFKWERLNTAGHSHPVSTGHWVAPLHND